MTKGRLTGVHYLDNSYYLLFGVENAGWLWWRKKLSSVVCLHVLFHPFVHSESWSTPHAHHDNKGGIILLHQGTPCWWGLSVQIKGGLMKKVDKCGISYVFCVICWTFWVEDQSMNPILGHAVARSMSTEGPEFSKLTGT